MTKNNSPKVLPNQQKCAKYEYTRENCTLIVDIEQEDTKLETKNALPLCAPKNINWVYLLVQKYAGTNSISDTKENNIRKFALR